MRNKIFNLRRDYSGGALDESMVPKVPLDLFNNWLEEALSAKLPEPHAFSLSTISGNRPSSRILLLRDATVHGFLFFSNYNSKKGHDLKIHPQASMHFFWPELSRQIRIEGTVKKVNTELSDKYFASRPRENQLAALASDQSEVVLSRNDLERRYHQLDQLHKGNKIPRPEYWGGYRLLPDYFEFWQGRESRLHDRIQYRKHKGHWLIERLSP